MSKKTPAEPVKATRIFTCETCLFECEGGAAFKEHLVTVHKITDTKGTKSLMAHIDCADSYHSTYQWDIGGLKFVESTSNPRSKDDPMRYG